MLNMAMHARPVADLDANTAMVPRDRPLAAVGRTDGEAFDAMDRLELSCRAPRATMACGTPLVHVRAGPDADARPARPALPHLSGDRPGLRRLGDI